MPSRATPLDPVPRRLSGTPAFAVVAAVIGLALAASAAPSPLYAVYQADWHFSTLVLTLVYAVYCLGVLAALLVAGSLSDEVGRRPVLAAALGGLILSTAVFALADSVAWLFAARLLQGIATGVALAAAGAALLDLHPRGDGHRVGLVNGVVSGAGMGAGSLVAAALVEYGPAPRVLPFVVLAGLFALALAATAALPEPVVRATRPRLRVQRPRVPRATRGAFLLASLGVLASWSIGGIYLSLGPELASGMLHTRSHMAGGVAILALTVPGVLAQLRWHRVDAHRAASAGATVLAVGMAALVASLSSGVPALFLAASALTGAGWGVAFLGALRALTAAMPPHQRAEVMSALYVVAYLSLAAPAIAAGLLAPHLGLSPTFRIFGALVIALGLAVAALARRMRARAVACAAA